jgi:hypothetical protein
LTVATQKVLVKKIIAKEKDVVENTTQRDKIPLF